MHDCPSQLFGAEIHTRTRTQKQPAVECQVQIPRPRICIFRQRIAGVPFPPVILEVAERGSTVSAMLADAAERRSSTVSTRQSMER